MNIMKILFITMAASVYFIFMQSLFPDFLPLNIIFAIFVWLVVVSSFFDN